MKKYIFFLMGAVCFLLSSSAVHANELNKSDANIIGHLLDENTEEHLSFISVSLKGTGDRVISLALADRDEESHSETGGAGADAPAPEESAPAQEPEA